jgi:acyl-CoA reductase-like NAD-dependent aldehyde dehydrogenase
MIIHSFINGQFTKASQRTFTKKNPFTGEAQHEVHNAGLLEAVKAIQTAQKFFLEYKQSSLDERVKLLKSIRLTLSENKKVYAALEAQDQGLPLNFTSEYGLQSLLTSLDKVLDEVSTPHVEKSKHFGPVGVMSLICSWNLSLRLIGERLFPALAAGNCVVVKVSSQSPVTAFILSELIQKSHLPAGLVQVIVSNDIEVKKILVSHPGVKAVAFVGQLSNSSDVLKLVSSSSAQQFKKVQISSGAKNSAAVLTEPTEKIFFDVMQSFLVGQGQLAWNSTRLFLLEKNENAWHEKIKSYLSTLKPSEGIEDSSLWTPCLKVESYQTFSEISALAVADQARLLKAEFALNEKQRACFLPITFTQDMSNCSTLQQDQVMSPLFILSTVKYPFDIQKYSNVSYFGMAAHLWGEEERLLKVADFLDVGLICLNKWSVQLPGASRSVKQSGFGLQDDRVFGDFFSNVKVLA